MVLFVLELEASTSRYTSKEENHLGFDGVWGRFLGFVLQSNGLVSSRGALIGGLVLFGWFFSPPALELKEADKIKGPTQEVESASFPHRYSGESDEPSSIWIFAAPRRRPLLPARLYQNLKFWQWLTAFGIFPMVCYALTFIPFLHTKT
jgi:hypothetical protein